MNDDSKGYSDPGFSELLSLPKACYCGRTFLQQNALSNHRRSCQQNKKRLSSVLDSAREVFSKRKKARTAYILPANLAQDEIPAITPPVNNSMLVGLIHRKFITS